MLEEIIKELTATKTDDHITSGGMLLWAKGAEVPKGPGNSIKYIDRIQAVR